MSAAKPMGADRRITAYLAQRDDGDLTSRQIRRMNSKANRARGLLVGRVLTPRQSRWAGIRAARAARKAALR